ncbi:hypothetical protein CMU91_15140 [Elizabethkingia anophelis]|nr:hypothetical protein [Elizabethkingia anophelis]
MARRNNTQNNSLALFNSLGTKAGTIISICTILGIVISVTTYATNIIKNIEILEIKTQFSVKEIEYKSRISDLEYEVKTYKIKLSNYETK